MTATDYLSAFQKFMLHDINQTDRWTPDDDRYAYVSRLGVKLESLKKWALVEQMGNHYQLTDRGIAALDEIPSLDHVILGQPTYAGVLECASALDADQMNSLELTGRLKGNSVIGEMVAMGLFEKLPLSQMTRNPEGPGFLCLWIVSLTDYGRELIAQLDGVHIND